MSNADHFAQDQHDNAATAAFDRVFARAGGTCCCRTQRAAKTTTTTSQEEDHNHHRHPVPFASASNEHSRSAQLDPAGHNAHIGERQLAGHRHNRLGAIKETSRQKQQQR